MPTSRALMALALAGWMTALCAVVVGRAEQAAGHSHHAPPQAMMLTSPLRLTPEDLAAGKSAYDDSCARCHGSDGKADTPRARRMKIRPTDLTRPELRRHRDGEIYWVISRGIPDSDMPDFEGDLPDKTRWQVVAYVRSLAGAAVAAENDRSDYVWDLPQGFPRPRVPPDNPMTLAKVELGRHLFYDTRLSLDETFSCATCHQQALAFTDGKPQGVGVTAEVHPRGSMGLANVVYSPVLTWANPTQRRLETQALVPMFGEEPVELGMSGLELRLLERLVVVPRYHELFTRAFPYDTDPFNLGSVTRALAAFQRTLISGRSTYDRYRFGAEPTAISESAKRGEALFFDERTECFHCHGGFNFTETVDHEGKSFLEIEFHNTGLYNIGDDGAYPEPNTGVHAISGDPEDMGRFKAPSLRNIALTAPYMHDGSITTLDGVIDHYAAGGRTIASGPNKGIGANSPHKSAFVKGFELTAEERQDLLAFLRSLTDEAFVTDPRFADPWKK